MMEVKQNTAVDLNDLLAPVKNTDVGTDEVDDVVMTDLSEGARDLNCDLIKSNEKSNNGLITNGDETLSSLIDLDATATALGAPVVSTELEDALLAEDDVLPKLKDVKVNVAPSSVAVDDILADKVETSNSTTSSNNVRDPGDDLDTLLSKINDIVEDCLDNEITAAAVDEKEEEELTKDTEENGETSEVAADSKGESMEESVIILDDTTIEESNLHNDKTSLEEIENDEELIENHQEVGESEVDEAEKETEVESSQVDDILEENDLNCENSNESETKEFDGIEDSPQTDVPVESASERTPTEQSVSETIPVGEPTFETTNAEEPAAKIDTEEATEKDIEVATEIATEIDTEVATVTDTEVSTKEYTEVVTEIDTEVSTEIDTEVATDIASVETVATVTPALAEEKLEEKEEEALEAKSDDSLSDVTKIQNTNSIISEKQIEEDSKLLEENIVDEIEPKTDELEYKNDDIESTNGEIKTAADEQEQKVDEPESRADDKETKINDQELTAVENDSKDEQHKEEEKVDNEDSDDEIVFYVDKPPEKEKPKAADESESTTVSTEKSTEEEKQQKEKSKSADDDDIVILDDDEDMDTAKKVSEPSSSQTKEESSKVDTIAKEPPKEQIEEKSSTAVGTTDETAAKEDKKHSTIDIDNSDNARDDFVVTEKPVGEDDKQTREAAEETNSNCSSSSNLLLEAKQNENTGDEPTQEENEIENEEEDDDGDVELIESESKEAEISSEKGDESSEIVPPAKRPRLSEDSEVSSKTDETSRSRKTSESAEKKTDMSTEVTSTATSTNTTPSLKRTHDVIELEIDDDKSNDSKTSSVETLNKKARTEEEIKPKEDKNIVVSLEEEKPEAKIEDDTKEDAKKDTIKMVPSDVPIPLYPPPKLRTLCSEDSFSLDFLKKFRKSFDKMTKQDLEELVLQKVVEAIIHRSEFAEMRELIEKQEKLITSHRTKISELSKQFRDLEMVHNRVVKDIDQRNSQFIMPVKITRAVGLQVYIPNKKAVLESTAISNTPNVPTSSPQRPVASAQNNLTSPQRQYHHSSQIGDSQVRVGSNTSSNTINSSTSNTPGQRRGCAQKITPIRPMPSSNAMSSNATPPSSANTQVYRNNLNQNQISSQPRILNKNASTATVGASSNPNPPPIQRQRYVQQSSQETTQQQRIQPQQQHQQQIIRTSANAVNSQRVVTQQKLSTNAAAVQRRPEPTASAGSNSSASLDSYMSTLSQLTGGNTAVSITPAKPKEKAVIDLTDEDETPPAPPVISAPPTNSVPVNQVQRRSLPTQGTNSNSTLQQYGRAAPPLSRIPPSSQMANSNKNRQIGLQGQKNNSAFASTISTPPGTSITRINVAANTQGPQRVKYSHPAPLPATPPQAFNPSWKLPPPRPTIRISNLDNGIVISWTMEESMDRHAECVSYQIYAYQETSGPPTGDSWRHVGDVKAMLLPMAVTLTQFQEGQRYYFAVRAVDCHQRYGPFSLPKTWS